MTVPPTQGLPGPGRPLCSACFDCQIFLGRFLTFSNTSRANSQLLAILLCHPPPETDLPVGRGTQCLRQWVLTDMFSSKRHYSSWKSVRIGHPEPFKNSVPKHCTTRDPEKEDEETCKPKSDRSLVFRTCKGLSKFNKKKINIPIIKWARLHQRGYV